MEESRKDKIIKLLSSTPTTATTLADRFGVSRQIIVSDIAVLRASGHDILSTPRGYIMNKTKKIENYYTVTCMHNTQQLPEELYLFVDNGATIIDVVIEHGVYGQISCPLYISSRFDCDQFVNKILNSNSSPLCELTNGIHMHTLSCPDEACYQRIIKALRDFHFLVDEE